MRSVFSGILLKIIFFAGIGPVQLVHAQTKVMQDIHLYWDRLSSLPSINDKPSPGVAGAFSGISNNQLMIAGGANFPDKPAAENGIKKYWNSIQVMALSNGRSGQWLKTVFHLPYPVAYGASLTLSRGIVCIGGKNDHGYISSVLLLQWNELAQQIGIDHLPGLPQPLASMAAACIGSTIYVAGGENKQGKQDCFYRIDLGSRHPSWETLPSLPDGGLSDAVLVSQSNGSHSCIYLLGGRTAEKKGSTIFYNSIYVFDPINLSWSQRQGIMNVNHQPVGLAAGTGVAIGDRYILLIGGDDGRLFNELALYKRNQATALDDMQKQSWQQRYDSLFIHHPGFNRVVYLYNTLTDTWTAAGSLPFPAQVTTNLISYKGKIIIPCGEIRPGVRTPDIMSARIEGAR